MQGLQLHHVAVISRDLERSTSFYENVLGFTRIARPPFTVQGAWYGLGQLQVHIVVHAGGSFRGRNMVDNDDVHFALRTNDFEATIADLHTKGYREDLPEGDMNRILIKRAGLAGFPQVFFMDPDANVIEINQAPLT